MPQQMETLSATIKLYVVLDEPLLVKYCSSCLLIAGNKMAFPSNQYLTILGAAQTDGSPSFAIVTGKLILSISYLFSCVISDQLHKFLIFIIRV